MLRSQLKLDRFNKVSLARRFYLIGFIAPEGELLSFASPKESNQRKGDPVAAYILCSSLSTRVARRAILGPLATRFIHEAPLRAVLGESCGARRGKRDKIVSA
jgi:hypothetical protein